VHFPLTGIAGVRVETIEFPDTEAVTVNTVLRRLAEGCSKDYFKYVYDIETGTLKSFLHILVNGKSISTLSGFRTELADGDVLAIFPPAGGG